MSKVFEITNVGEYSAFKNNHPRAIIFYSAEWCTACKEIKPLYTRIANRYWKRVAMAYVDIDTCQLDFSSIPVFVALYEGKQINSMEGASESGLKALVKETIEHNTTRKVAAISDAGPQTISSPGTRDEPIIGHNKQVDQDEEAEHAAILAAMTETMAEAEMEIVVKPETVVKPKIMARAEAMVTPSPVLNSTGFKPIISAIPSGSITSVGLRPSIGAGSKPIITAIASGNARSHNVKPGVEHNKEGAINFY